MQIISKETQRELNRLTKKLPYIKSKALFKAICKAFYLIFCKGYTLYRAVKLSTNYFADRKKIKFYVIQCFSKNWIKNNHRLFITMKRTICELDEGYRRNIGYYDDIYKWK